MRSHKAELLALLALLVALGPWACDPRIVLPGDIPDAGPDAGAADRGPDTETAADSKPKPDAGPACASWVVTMGGTGDNTFWGDDHSQALVIGPQQEIYVAGGFGGYMYVAGKLKTGAVGKTDAFLAKLGSTGTLEWLATMGGPEVVMAEDVACDSDGNVLVSGRFEGTAKFGFGTTAQSKTAKGQQDGFVTGFPPGGGAGPVGVIAGALDDRVSAIALDKSDDLYLAGDFQAETTFETLSLKSTAKQALFAAKMLVTKAQYSISYAADWVHPSVGTGTHEIRELALDDKGYVYIAGTYDGEPVIFGNKLPKTSSPPNLDAFVAKLDPSGNGTLLWSVTANGPGDDAVIGLALDKAGNLYAGGVTEGSATFTGGTQLTSQGKTDGWIAKLDGSGKVQWVEPVGASAEEELVNAIALAPNGELLVAGSFTGSITLGSGASSCSLASKGDRDGFVARLDGTARGCLGSATGGGAGADTASVLDLDAKGAPVVAGSFEKSATFGSKKVTAKGQRDVYVWRPCLK